MTIGPYVVHAGAAPAVLLGGLGARFLMSNDALAIVEHPLEPRALGSPIHTHTREDEYSCILEGEVGIQLGDEVITARPGMLIIKPKDIPHAFWNPGDVPARLLEIISPSGFERYFAEVAAVLPVDGPPAPEHLAEIVNISARYGLAMDFESMPRLIQEHALAG